MQLRNHNRGIQTKRPVLHEVAKIVHSTGTRDTGLASGGVGLNAIMSGARFNVRDNFKAVEKAAHVYDALCIYCKIKLLQEKH